MTAKLYFAIVTILYFLYGLCFLLFPGGSLELYGVAPEPHVNAALRFFGVALITLSLMTWFARDFEWAAMRKILIVQVIGDVLFAALSILEMRIGVINAMGWSTVVLDVLLIVGAIYCMNSSVRPSDMQRRTA
jgi:hypothetical protein